MAAKKRYEGKLTKKRDPERFYFVEANGRICSVARKKKKTAKKRKARRK